MKTTSRLLTALLLATAAVSAQAGQVYLSSGDGTPYVLNTPEDSRSFAQAQAELGAQLNHERATNTAAIEIDGMPVAFEVAKKDGRSFAEAQREVVAQKQAAKQHPTSNKNVWWSVSGT